MATLRGLLLGVTLAAAVAAQQRVQLFDCRDVFANLDRHLGPDFERPMIRPLQRIVTRMFAGSAKTRVATDSDGNLVLMGGNDQFETMSSALAQLRRPDLQELRLQCTLVSMPLSVAIADGMATGKVLEVDEVKAGKVLKDAVAAKGTLRNLPEGGCLPLQPGLVGKMRGDARGAEAASDPFGHTCVRAEALPIADDEAWFALQLARDAGRDFPPPLEGSVRLKLGGGAMMMAALGEQAVVLWVRFVSSRNAEAVKEAATTDRTDKSGLPVRLGK
jgi:hypothetical protein